MNQCEMMLRNSFSYLVDSSLERNLTEFFTFAYELIRIDKSKERKFTKIFMKFVKDDLLK